MPYSFFTILKKDDELYNNIQKIVLNSHKIHSNQILYTFTDHGENHSQRMILFLEKLLSDNKQTKLLNKYEVFILVASVYLHDIGIQFNNLENIKYFCKENNIAFDSIEDINKFIREEHHLLSAFWIQLNIKKESCISDAYIGDTLLGKYISFVVKSHGIDFSKLTEYNKKISFKGCRIRLKLLCVLLCLSDAIDCDCRRIDINKLTYNDIPLGSRIHWYKHYYVQSVEIDKKIIHIYYSFPILAEKQKKPYELYFSSVSTYWINRIKEQYLDDLSEVGIHFDIKESIEYDDTKIELPTEEYNYLEERIFDLIKKNASVNYKEVSIGVLIYKNSILMVKRKNPENDLLWQFPAGVLKASDLPEKAIEREVLEETGIYSKVKKAIGKRLHPDTQTLCYYFSLEYIEGDIINGDTEENCDVQWVKIDEYENYITSDIFIKVKNYIQKENE